MSSLFRFQPFLRRLLATKAAAAGPAPLVNVWDTPAASNGHVRVIELNRPAARNALSLALVTSLRAEIDRVHAQYGADGTELRAPTDRAASDGLGPTRAVVLASSSSAAFCAGADLKERRGWSEEQTLDFLHYLRETFSALESLPVPTISAVSAAALGGGLELALATDFRVMARDARVGLPETGLGIIPGAGGTYRLRRLVGASRALRMILTGQPVSGLEAADLGLADRLADVATEEATDPARTADEARAAVRVAALALAKEICQGAPIAIRAALEAVRRASPEAEDDMYRRVLASKDRLEALDAFREKRKPVFKGR